MKLVIVGPILAATAVLVLAHAHSDDPDRSSRASAATIVARATAPARDVAQVVPTSHDYCAEANAFEANAFDLYNINKNYRASYNAAVKGLAASEQCSRSNAFRDMHDGFLLSVKGMAEHHLPNGDSQTDLNQANVLLMKCQTAPGFYGTHNGAFCETQMQNNISWQVRWQMDR
jgi:hypothetical protein